MMIGDLISYFSLLFEKYQTIASLVVPSFVAAWALNIFVWLENRSGRNLKQLIPPGRVLIALLAMFIMGFLAWRDEHEKLIAANSKITEISNKTSYALSLSGVIDKNYADGSDDIKLNLNMSNSSNETIEIFASSVLIVINSGFEITKNLQLLKLRPREETHYEWLLGKPVDLPSVGNAKLKVSMLYGAPGAPPTRNLISEIVVEYKITNSVVSSQSRKANEQELPF